MAKTGLRHPRRKRGRPPHQPTARDRRAVETLAAHGIPTGQIAAALQIGVATVYRHYRAEIERGAAKVEAALIANLVRMSKGNDGIAAKATCSRCRRVLAGAKRCRRQTDRTGI